MYFEPRLEPYCEPETPADYGWVYEEDLPDYYYCQKKLECVLNAVYQTGDVNALENALDELVSIFNLKLPETEPVLVNDKSRTRTDKLLGEWLQMNQEHNNNLKNHA